MKTQVIYNSDLHFEHNQWRSELAFWEDELKSFKNRLEELVLRWTDKDMLAQLEHYQNAFIRQGEVIDILQHDIHVHEANMSALDNEGEDALDRVLVKNHVEFRNRMETQRHIYAELKKEFFRFLTKYM
ncbi:hypothetical protein [Winogradskyella thalassocola]|uniref:Uncharacterized protein n=1 Tax=Winogradskyella thalassocola TaxID=262004 RepID=A0A1G8BDJ4_9FLAO|nr:hypothetical protein [Winogradskyella thalassocola]SDH31312.1 hypothetical protein SAMN04489796_102308 [Winogradskyella thalassocola]